MPLKSIPAHFDGESVRFDEEVVIPPKTKLLVTILEEGDEERADFLALANTSFADLYGEDEVEYSEADLRK